MKVQIFNSLFWVDEVDPKKIKKICVRWLRLSKFTLKGKLEVYFDPQGYTVVWVLAESHLAIHTFPEGKATRIELSSCNYKKYIAFKKLVKASGKKGKRKIQKSCVIELS